MTLSTFDFMTTLELCDELRCNRMKLWRLVRKGRFPRPIKCGQRNLWDRRQIVEWVAAGGSLAPASDAISEHAASVC